MQYDKIPIQLKCRILSAYLELKVFHNYSICNISFLDNSNFFNVHYM